MRNFADRLFDAVEKKNSVLCVGLDPHIHLLPRELTSSLSAPEAVREFIRGIIEAVAPYVACVKPQIAFFESLGHEGFQVYEDVVRISIDHGLLVIGDVKRGDIGSTAAAYSAFHLGGTGDFPGADAVTVNAYLGWDGVKPFVDVAREKGKGLFVLVKTSNPSSADLQDLDTVGGGKVYCQMGELATNWGSELIGERGWSSVGAVVGATYPAMLTELRGAFPSTPFLVPGYGAQGATADTLSGGFDKEGFGAVVNSSRGVIFAYRDDAYAGQDWKNAAAKAAENARDELNAARGSG